MTRALFPAHVRTLDDAIAFLPRWAEMIGGELISGIETDELVGAGGALSVVRVRPFRVLFHSSATELTVRLVFSAELEPFGYSFDLRRDTGALLWRHDCHEGHEHEHGGPWHLHIGPDENHRVWSEPMTLASIADKVVATHINLTG